MTRGEGTRPESERRGKDEREEKDAEILPKLPDDAPADQERGERHTTGKDIATGGEEPKAS